MTGRLHQPKRLVEFPKREDTVRQRTGFAIEERRGDLGQQPTGEIRPANRQLIDVDCEVRDVLPKRAQMNPAVKIKVSLAEFEKSTKRLEYLQAPFHRLAAQRVEHDVDPSPLGKFAHGIAEGEVSRIKDAIGASQSQKCPFHLRSGCRNHYCAALFGVLNR